MPIDDQTLRRQLLFRSWHRGTREMDLILGRFAEGHLAAMDRERLDGYARLLEKADPDIYLWLSGEGLWRQLMASISPEASKDA